MDLYGNGVSANMLGRLLVAVRDEVLKPRMDDDRIDNRAVARAVMG